jgi:hypothetical protein
MKCFFILLSLILILSMGCIGGQNSSAGSLDGISDSDFAFVDPGFEDDNVTPVEVSAQ